MSSRLLINEPPLVVIPGLAEEVGLNEAIILQQIHYWLNPKYNKTVLKNRLWVGKTMNQWLETMPFWGESTVRRALATLQEKKLILTTIKMKGLVKVKLYTIDYTALETLLDQHTQTTPSCDEEPPHDVQDPSEQLPNDTGSSSEEGMHTQDTQDSHHTTPSSRDDFPETAEDCGSVRNGQNEQIDLSKSSNRSVQNEQIDPEVMNKSYKEGKNEGNIINTPPLTPPHGISEEEEDDEDDSNQSLIEEAIAVWNETVQQERPPVRLTRKRSAKIKSLIQQHLGGTLEGWKDFCQKISDNPFLMGKGSRKWSANLEWVLKEDNAVGILEDRFYYELPDGVMHEHPNPSASLTELTVELKEKAIDPTWRAISLELAKSIGVPTYKSWLMDCKASHDTQGVLTLKAKNAFRRDQIEQKFKVDLLKSIRAIEPQIQSVQIVCGG